MGIDEWDIAIKGLTLSVVMIGAWRGFMEYRKTQDWKKAEFLATEYKKFVDDQDVKNAFLILDGYKILNQINDCTNLIKDYKRYKPIKKLIKALSEKDSDKRDELEEYIVLCIDRFLFKLGIFNSYIELDLGSKEQVWSYLSYWIKLIGGSDEKIIDMKAQKALKEFIETYKYESVISLVKKYEDNLKQTTLKTIHFRTEISLK